MAETVEERRGLYWFIYFGIAMALFFLNFLPQQMLPTRLAPPDILLALTLAWTIRRPEFVPLALVAVLFLMADLLYHRPPGVFAAATIIGLEFLRSRAQDMRRAAFAIEWIVVGVTIIGVFALTRIITGLALVAQPPLGLSLVQMALTIAIYPVVVVISHYVFGVRSTLQGSVEDIGSRL
jgi:rod shape-determining protein MreD